MFLKSGNPIGIFDSGIGGINVFKEIIKILPNENIVYLGDTARVPYGSKSKEIIIRYSIENTKYLLKHKIKLLVVACNTSSSYAIPTLRKILHNIPVIGVIDPGAKKAVELTKANRIGVIGTQATINSNSYAKRIFNYSKNKKIKVYSNACPLFVPLIEEGWMDKIYQEKYYENEKKFTTVILRELQHRMINHENILRYVASEYLLNLKLKKIDVLVLGCTHYPAIKNIIKDVIGENVALVDSAQETAKYVFGKLNSSKILNTNNKKIKYQFFVTDAPEKFKLVGSWLLQKDIKKVEKINLPF